MYWTAPREPPLAHASTGGRSDDAQHSYSYVSPATIMRTTPLRATDLGDQDSEIPIEAFAARYYLGYPGHRDLLKEQAQTPAVVTRRETTVDHTCTPPTTPSLDAFPPGDTNPHQFWAVWEGRWFFEAMQYRFTVTARDGFRLYVDGELVHNAWRQVSEGRVVVKKW